MNTIPFQKGNVQVIAHRGLSGLEKENTNAAFVAAGNRSYFGIETDVRRTADGKFILNHDNHFRRVAGENLVVEASTAQLIHSVQLPDIDGAMDRVDLHPAKLENYLSICKRYEKKCVLELKDPITKEDLAAIIEVIRSIDYLENVIFISFEYEHITMLRALLPQQPAQYLAFELNEEIIQKAVAADVDVNIRHQALTQALIEKAHAAGRKVNCWTVNTQEDGERLAAWGVDYITTNILE